LAVSKQKLRPSQLDGILNPHSTNAGPLPAISINQLPIEDAL